MSVELIDRATSAPLQEVGAIGIANLGRSLEPDTEWAQAACAALLHLQNADIVIDVDNTLYDGDLCGEGQAYLRPGTIDLLSALKSQGNRLHLWSRRSGTHAAAIGELFGFDELRLVDGYHNKPFATDISLHEAEQILGFTPTATIDNDPLDQIIDAPHIQFVEVEDYYARKPALITV